MPCVAKTGMRSSHVQGTSGTTWRTHMCPFTPQRTTTVKSLDRRDCTVGGNPEFRNGLGNRIVLEGERLFISPSRLIMLSVSFSRAFLKWIPCSKLTGRLAPESQKKN